MASKSPADTRKCDPSLQFDVDVLILDYLAYNSMKSILRHAAERPADHGLGDLPFEVTNGLRMVESFLDIFGSSHASAELPSSLHFRLRLVRFAALFVYRSTSSVVTPSPSSLVALREENRKRAGTWLSNAKANTLTSELADWYSNVTPTVQSRTRESRDSIHSPLPALLDILPFFIELTAMRSNEGACPVGDAWFKLAAEFMLQAVLQQYNELQRNGPKSFMEAFAWGFDGIAGVGDLDDKVDNEADATVMDTSLQDFTIELKRPKENANIVFCDVEPVATKSGPSLLHAKANRVWTQTRREYIDFLLPASDVGNADASNANFRESDVHLTKTTRHLRAIVTAHPLAEFDDAILAFLDGMNESVAKPMLVQLELADAAREDGREADPVFEIDVDFERITINGHEARELKDLVRRLK